VNIKSGAAFLAIASAIAAIVYVLMLKPVTGVADNGDFLRIMQTVGLDYLEPEPDDRDKYFGYFIREYRLDGLGAGGYVSTQIVLVFAATLLNRLLYSQDVFDIRFLAAVYTLLLLAAYWAAFRFHRSRPTAFHIALGILLVFLFTDAGYIAYFNSLFGEPVSFVFLLLTVVLALGLASAENPRRGLLAAFFVCAVFLTGSKIQNAPIGILLAILCLRFLHFRSDRAWRKTVISFAAILALGSIAMFVFAPKELKAINMYQTVFFGILKDSPTPERDLEELGLPKELAVLAGTNFFTPDTPIPQRDPMLDDLFYSRMSHGKVAAFYLKHPGRLLAKLEIAAQNGMSIRPYYLGTYEKSEGRPYGAVSETFAFWSSFKSQKMPNTLWFLVPFCLAYFAVLIREHRRAANLQSKVYAETFAVLAAIGMISFAVPVIGDGEADLGKHLFLFNVCFDLMFAASLLWIVHRLALRFSGRKSAASNAHRGHIS
jgi:hypothetical protein